MWKWVALCVLMVLVEANGDIRDQMTETIQRCCNDGSGFARSHTENDCSSSQPVPSDVPSSLGSLCIMARAQCCKEYFRKKKDCDSGISTASTRNQCDSINDSNKACCDECVRGISIGHARGSAACVVRANAPTAEELLSGDAYIHCCLKAARESSSTSIAYPIQTAKKEKREHSTMASVCEDYAPNELCAHYCIPLPGSYKCECKPGFMLMPDGRNCKEVVNNRCKPRNPCQHKCNDNGVKMMCSCRRGYELMPDGKSCQDIDECQLDIPVCLPETKCHNVQGSYRCIPVNKKKKNSEKGQCPPGFAKNFNNNCDDINECKLPHPPCPSYLCENTVGGYKCGGMSGDPINLSSTPRQVEEDRCPPGFALGTHGDCEDVDECATSKDDCNPLSQYCINTHGTFFCQEKVSKQCRPGFKISPETNKCEDINECEENNDLCRSDQICVNQLGQYDCKPKPDKNRQRNHPCSEGMRLNPSTLQCDDINECLEGTHLCDQHQNCLNTNGSFVCHCKLGYELDTVTGACFDVNECATGQHDCISGSQRCDNTVGSFLCIRITSCGTGYILQHSTGKCEDVDECALGIHNCARAGPEFQCFNIPGSFRCVKKRQSTTTTTPAPGLFYDEYEYYDSEEETDGNKTSADPKPAAPPAPVFIPFSETSEAPTSSSTTEPPTTPKAEPRVEDNSVIPPEPDRGDNRQYMAKPEATKATQRTTSNPTPVTQSQSGYPYQPEESKRQPDEPRHQPEEPRHHIEEPRHQEPRYHPEEPRYHPEEEPRRQPEEPRHHSEEPRYNPEIPRPVQPEPKPTENPRQESPQYRPPEPEIAYSEPRPESPQPEIVYREPSESPHHRDTPDSTYYETRNGPDKPISNEIIPENTERPEPESPSEHEPKIVLETEPTIFRLDSQPVPTYSPYRPTEKTSPTPPYEVYVNVGEESATVSGERRDDRPGFVDRKDVPENKWNFNTVKPDRPTVAAPCLSGFEANEYGGCFDIDECVTNRHSCSGLTETCRNTLGGYLCDCAPGFRRDQVTGACVVISVSSTTPLPQVFNPDLVPAITPIYHTEPVPSSTTSTTSTTTEPPPPPTTTPSTTPVSVSTTTERVTTPQSFWGYKDDRFAATRPFFPRFWCDAGYIRNQQTGRCEDIDECTNRYANCASVEVCVNTEGGYRCECQPNWRLDQVRQRCVPELDRGRFPTGYGNEPVYPQVPQVDQQETSHVDPDPEITQIEDRGTVLKCPWGYRLVDDRNCVDIDECVTGEAKCGPMQICTNMPGRYVCSCPQGHHLIGDNKCEDDDECDLAGNEPICSHNADCVNTIGSYQCKCRTGFRSAPINDKVCVDVDECSEARQGSLCEHRCSNVWGSYRCFCHRGYRLNADNRTCSDVDECVRFKSKIPCVGKCLNEPGSYRCTCPTGYRLSEDKRSCIDIDECETGEATCQTGMYGGTSHVCFNTRGSYRCQRITCPPGYQLESKHRCTKTERVCSPGDWECAHQPTTISYNFITFVSKLYIPESKECGNTTVFRFEGHCSEDECFVVTSAVQCHTLHCDCDDTEMDRRYSYHQAVKLFTMRGPTWQYAKMKFELRLNDVNAPPSVKDRADINSFLLIQTDNEAVVSLVRPLEGPQSIELELAMELYSRDQFGGIAIAKLFIFVSEYEF